MCPNIENYQPKTPSQPINRPEKMVTKKIVASSCVTTILIGLVVASGISGGYLGNYEQDRNNLITVIEDRTSEPAGFMVMTADYNYAIYSPRFAEFKWRSVTVNGAQVFIVSEDNTTLTTGLFDLNEPERDFIAEVRSGFIQNLAGLKLTHSSYNTQKPFYSDMDIGEQSHATNAIDQIRGLSYAVGAQRAAERNTIEQHRDVAPGAALIAPKDTPFQARSHRNPNATEEVFNGRSLLASRGRSYFGYNNGRMYDNQDQQQQHQYGPHYSFVPAHPAAKSSQSSYCSRRSATNFNYYNLRHSHLASSLCGDIYNFDMRCNTLDVYSDSVTISQQTGVSVLYRDHRYFALARSGFPVHINRLFLVGERVFFVYSDGSLLLKQNWLLDEDEFELVVRARRQLQAVSSWRTKPAQASGTTSQADDDADAKKRQLINNKLALVGLGEQKDDKNDGKSDGSQTATSSSGAKQ